MFTHLLTLALFVQAPAAGSGHMKNKMLHCPTAVEGATASVKNTKGGVEITVTAKDENAVQEIRKRAAHQAEVSTKADAGKHTGEGEGGGGEGYCPVVMKDTTVTATDVKGGSKITIVPEKGKGTAKDLQKMVKDRMAAKPAAPPAEKKPAEKKSAAPAPAPEKAERKAAAGGGW